MKLTKNTVTMLATSALAFTSCTQQQSIEKAVDQVMGSQERQPNFVMILVDDMGFSDLGAFGGEIPTPNIDRLANEGTILTNFYANATSTPSRSMLFSGRDNHQSGIGNMPSWRREEQKGQPGYEGYLPLDVPAFPEMLQANGYYTMHTGKWDLGDTAEYFPIARGFDDTRAALVILSSNNHYSYADGSIYQTYPKVNKMFNRTSFYNDRGVEIKKFPRQFYSTDFYTDMTIDMLADRDPAKPFFASVCYTAPHWPLQAPADVTAKYMDLYAKGWDVIRQERFERLKALGFLPKDAVLPSRPEDVPAWDSLSEEERKVQIKTMAIYAAMIDVLDHNVGRLVDYLKEIGEYENTVIFFSSDNGASSTPLAAPEGNKEIDNSYENLGNYNSFVGYGNGWAMASGTPFNEYKGSTFEGGVHVPAFIHYPKSKVSGVKYDCLYSVIDIAATTIDMSGGNYPKIYNGKPLAPLPGVSMANLFDGSLYCDSDRWLGWELNGVKGLRIGSWTLSQHKHDEHWYLFNLVKDPYERDDLSEKEPEKLEDLLGLHQIYMEENGVIEVPNH